MMNDRKSLNFFSGGYDYLFVHDMIKTTVIWFSVGGWNKIMSEESISSGTNNDNIYTTKENITRFWVW